MTMRQNERLNERLDAVRRAMQSIANDFDLTFEGHIEMTTNEPSFNDRIYVWRGFKYTKEK